MKVPRTNGKIVRQPLNDVRNLKTSEDTPNIRRNLRQRQVKNYRDSSLNNSSINKSKSDDKADRVPVYLKSALNEDEKKEEDPFEFIYDTPEAQKKKNRTKRKVRKQHRLPLGSKKGTKKPKEDSWSSDSSFHIISKAVKRTERRKINLKTKYVKPDKNANHCMIKNNKHNLTQTKSNQVLVNTEEHTTPSTNLNNLVIKDNYLINRLMESSQFEDVNKNEISTHKINDKSTELTNVEKRKMLDLRTKLVVQNNMNCSLRESFRKGVEVAIVKEGDQFFGFDDENEDLVFNNLSNIYSTPSKNKQITAMEPNTSAILTDKFKSLTSTPVHRANVTKRKKADTDCNKIKILSNVVLPSPRLFKRPQPNWSLNEIQQNETLGFVGFDNSNRRIAQRSPWRNDNSSLVRNPHFLQMKNTSLPCYNQEMVLDERLERSIGSKTPKPSEELNKSNKNLLQTSIIDYFNSSSLIIENSPAEQITNQTLFDNDQLSPLKNKSVLGQNNKPDRVKRNILGSINNVVANVSLVNDKDEENLTLDLSAENYGVEECFGFDDEDKENKKKKTKVNTKKKDKVGPTRYSISELKKVREAALQNISVGEIVDQDVSVSIEPIVEALPADEPQEEETTVGLFEDLIEIPDRKSYTRKRPRRVRIPSFQAEEKTVENDKQKRKKRDVRTKSEEEKLNNWAAEFNAMCEEVNQHELETV